ncbi:TlpA family protein disulfide reductase [Pedobacter duraquae]|uniref:Thiol-disulfide isomerase/thioredoxin n=1 Tax=Pedobacter duraquae TaxID=425511 RepID=A0A4V3C346_9SPHI|nr:TlpA disulfide reductase family protein [Pedobacter duraquae]TDO20689.1 thiol-disulfide isomerase/thioredoxin [Pedobacter duraquae]
MKLKMIFLLLSSFLPPVMGQIKAKRVIVTGEVINVTSTTPKVFGVNFLNPFEKTRKSASLDSTQHFAVQDSMLFTQNMTIFYNNAFINLYVVPGDSVHLVVDAAKLDQSDFKWLTISGDHAGLSTSLNSVHNFLAKLPYHKYNYALPEDQMLDEVIKDYGRYLIALNAYSDVHHLDKVIIEFCKKDIKYGISNWISDYVNNGNDSVSSKAGRIQMFSDSFFEFGSDSSFVSMMYPYHLANYMYWKVGLNPEIGAAIKLGRLQQAFRLAAEAIIDQPASISRDYMLFNYIAEQINKNSSTKIEVAPLAKYFTNAKLYNLLLRFNDNRGIVNIHKAIVSEVKYMGHTQTIQVFNQVDMLKMLSEKHPRKIIYIDIYATWCAPCIQEMSYATAMKKRLAGKEIVFVNICLQSTEVNWVKLLKAGKSGSENYYLGDDDSKLMMGDFDISGFPTYILIDQTGRIITTHAPRPSELNELEKEVERINRGGKKTAG